MSNDNHLVCVVDGAGQPARTYEFTSPKEAHQWARRVAREGYIGGYATVWDRHGYECLARYTRLPNGRLSKQVW